MHQVLRCSNTNERSEYFIVRTRSLLGKNDKNFSGCVGSIFLLTEK